MSFEDLMSLGDSTDIDFTLEKEEDDGPDTLVIPPVSLWQLRAQCAAGKEVIDDYQDFSLRREVFG